ncbi:hypothetical protein [Nocardia aurea]|nr:hypothetical protein [Nocardia aurea]
MDGYTCPRFSTAASVWASPSAGEQHDGETDIGQSLDEFVAPG